MANKIGILYFSPTKTTKRICNAIASGMGGYNVKIVNITLPDKRSEFLNNPEDFMCNIDHLIVGAPVYTGKLPLQVIECLDKIRGNGKTCTTVVVHGNRDYGIALKQMVEILTNGGFAVTSAGAFIGQHSYSDIIPVAMGRPDYMDLKAAFYFGEGSINKNQVIHIEDIPVQLDIFSKSKNYSPLVPTFKTINCNQCGVCSKNCPTGIISSETGDFLSKKAKKICIGCMACVKSCNYKARSAQPNLFMKFLIKKILKKAASSRTEPITIWAN